MVCSPSTGRSMSSTRQPVNTSGRTHPPRSSVGPCQAVYHESTVVEWASWFGSALSGASKSSHGSPFLPEWTQAEMNRLSSFINLTVPFYLFFFLFFCFWWAGEFHTYAPLLRLLFFFFRSFPLPPILFSSLMRRDEWIPASSRKTINPGTKRQLNQWISGFLTFRLLHHLGVKTNTGLCSTRIGSLYVYHRESTRHEWSGWPGRYDERAWWCRLSWIY